MLEKLKENSRVVVAVLIGAGLLLLLVNNSGNSNDSSNDQANVDKTVQTEDNNEQSNTEKNIDTGQKIFVDVAPPAGKVEVTKQDTNYSATIRVGDNQTLVVRQVVNDYLADNEESLSAEQRLYTETNLVNELPRSEIIQVGETITIDQETIKKYVGQSKELTESELNAWSKYL